MAETKSTRKEMFARIIDRMADDKEVVEMCEKYLEQLNKPRKKKVNEDMVAIGNEVIGYLNTVDEPVTNKELYTWYNENHVEEDKISAQKMAAVMRHLVGTDAAEKIVGDKVSDPTRYELKR